MKECGIGTKNEKGRDELRKGKGWSGVREGGTKIKTTKQDEGRSREKLRREKGRDIRR